VPIPVDQEADARGQPVRELTLDDALRIGRRYNVDLRSGELGPEQARADLQVADAVFQPEFYGDLGYDKAQTPTRNAFQPSVERESADATLGWRQRVVTGGLFDLAYHPARFSTSSSVPGTFPERQFTSEWSFSYTQPLLRGAWPDYNLAPIDAAEHTVARAQHTFEKQVQDTLELIVEAYWELAFARENYRVVIESLNVAREQLRITLERIRVRELAPRDRVADEAEVARREEERIAAENQVRRNEDELRRLLFDVERPQLWRWNLRPIDPIAITPSGEELKFAELAEVAIANRPDLKAARSVVAEAELTLLQASRDVLPSLDLVGGYNSDAARDSFHNAFADSIDQQFQDWSIRLQFVIPVGNQAARGVERRAQLEVERRQRNLYAAMLDVTKEVREAVRALGSLSQAILASAESVRLAESNLETEQVKLGVGSSTAFEVQRRNQELREARSRHLRNQLDYRIAQSRLLHAQGLLQEPRQ
jgi:outer membrane protein TolC